MCPQRHSQDQDFKSSRWIGCCSHQNQACESPLVGDACGPAEQASPSRGSRLMHLPPGPPCSTDRSVSGSKSISSAFSHSPPSPEHHIRMPGSAGQMPTSRAELLMMVLPTAGACQTNTFSILRIQSWPNALKAAPASIPFLYFVLLLICWSSYC